MVAELVDEQDDVGISSNLLEECLEAVLKLACGIGRSRDQRAYVEPG